MHGKPQRVSALVATRKPSNMPAVHADAALLDVVKSWRDRHAKADVRGLPKVSVPLLSAARKVTPDGSALRLLAATYRAAVQLSQPQTILRQAKAESLAELRLRALADCDAQARRVAARSGWLAGGSGAVFGIAGAAGLVADAPALLLMALRTLVRIGYCYGESPSPALVSALFALASADTEAEKRIAWNAALTAQGSDQPAAAEMSDAAIRDGLERAAEREFAKQALASSLQRLAVTLVQRLGLKKTAGLLPVVGAAVGGAVNIRFIYLLSEAARMAFAARRALANGAAPERLLLPKALAAAQSKGPPRAKAAIAKV